jgi:hypothetical protein
MDPNTAFSVGGMLEQQQQDRMANRAARLGGLSSLLSGYAGQGGDLGGAQALLDSQPGPMGPAVQQMIQAMYPQGAGDYGYQDPSGLQPGQIGGTTESPTPQAYQQNIQAQQMAQQSPTYTGNPAAVMQNDEQALQIQGMQADLMGAQAAAQVEPQWAAFQADAMLAKSKGQTIDQFMASVNANPGNAALLSSDPGKVQAIMENTFGHYPVQGYGAQVG